MRACLCAIAAVLVAAFLFWYGGLDMTHRSVDNAIALFLCLCAGLGGGLAGSAWQIEIDFEKKWGSK